MVILDEFQHLIDRDTDAVLKNASDWLKTFAEEANIPVVLCGLPESEKIFLLNEQLGRRYSNRCSMEAFGFETSVEKEAFIKFLNFIDKQLPFGNFVPVKEGDVKPKISLYVDKIYYVTNGIPAYVKELIKQATRVALKAGHDLITETDLSVAYHKITRSNRPFSVNPFGRTDFNLEKELEREFRENKVLSDPSRKGKKDK